MDVHPHREDIFFIENVEFPYLVGINPFNLEFLIILENI